jgi:hypothetical protein
MMPPVPLSLPERQKRDRERPDSSKCDSPVAALAHQELTPIREARLFVLEDSSGDLVKMSDV